MVRRRNPVPANPEKQAAYVYYVGTILAPKSKIPAAVYVQNERERFYVFTPDKEFGIGAGFYGESGGPGDCIRQHMQPGLLTSRDQGTGLGTALYLAGNMVIAAAREDASGDFPWRIQSNPDCTYSFTGDRTEDADRAWDNMKNHGLSTLVEGGAGESEEVHEDWDLEDDSVSKEYYEEMFVENQENEGVHSVEVDDFTVNGSVRVSGTVVRDGEADVMEWETIKESGLILHLGQFFDDPDDHMFIPPRVFAEADWQHTPHDWVVDFARQNAEAAKLYTARAARAARDKVASGADWIREAACHLSSSQSGRWRPGSAVQLRRASRLRIAEELLDMIGEGPQLQLWKRMRNPPMCPTTFARQAASWEKIYGDDFDEGGEPDGRKRKRGSRKKKNPSTKQLKSRLLR